MAARARRGAGGGSADATTAAAIEIAPIAAAVTFTMRLHHLEAVVLQRERADALPVAAKYALRTAGAAKQIVGSPTPPQNPPDGMMIDSTSASARSASSRSCGSSSARSGHP